MYFPHKLQLHETGKVIHKQFPIKTVKRAHSI